MDRDTIIGVDLGGTKVSVGAVRGSQVARIVTRPIPAQASAEVILDRVTDTIAEVVDETVVGMGVGVPSVVDVAEGIIRRTSNIPSWKEIHLRTALEKRFGVPAWINNDANAFVVGEHVFGAARGCDHAVGLTLGTGLGTGVIVNGRLYNGANCGAGELGVMAYRGGRLEDWCAAPFFRREAGISGEVLHERAREGDAAALDAFRDYGRELAEGVKIALYAYDPEILVFGGSIASAFDLFEGALREGLADFKYPHIIERVKITASKLKNAAVLGAAALHVDATRGGL
ncbi:MAG: ROK family protein [Thermoanaerobaculales bacterium]|nr:ROK family protein [Thermoanaerobaculales bacterium]